MRRLTPFQQELAAKAIWHAKDIATSVAKRHNKYRFDAEELFSEALLIVAKKALKWDEEKEKTLPFSCHVRLMLAMDLNQHIRTESRRHFLPLSALGNTRPQETDYSSLEPHCHRHLDPAREAATNEIVRIITAELSQAEWSIIWRYWGLETNRKEVESQSRISGRLFRSAIKRAAAKIVALFPDASRHSMLDSDRSVRRHKAPALQWDRSDIGGLATRIKERTKKEVWENFWLMHVLGHSGREAGAITGRTPKKAAYDGWKTLHRFKRQLGDDWDPRSLRGTAIDPESHAAELSPCEPTMPKCLAE